MMMNLEELEKALVKGIKSFFSVDFVPKGVVYFWKTLKLLTMLMIVALGGVFIYFMGDEVFHWWNIEERMYHSRLGYGYTYQYDYSHGIEQGFITDKDGRKVVKDVTCVRKEDGDSIVLFEQNYYRGYLNLKTGKQIVKADKYTAPLYWDIKAIDINLYVASLEMSSEYSVMLNEKGQEIGRVN